MQRLVAIILLSVIILGLITPLPRATAYRDTMTPLQVTEDLNLTKGGGWFKELPLNTDIVDEWGAVSIHRYPVSQIIGGYLIWDAYVTPWGFVDGIVGMYSYGYDMYTNFSVIFFDSYSVFASPYNITVDVVTDITSAPYNATYDAIYWTAVGYDYFSEYALGVPIYYSGIYGELTDGDFFRGSVGPGFFDFDLTNARALFGGDTNVYGIALTSLAVADGVIYTAGFFVYNDTNSIDMPPIVILFNATDLSIVNATLIEPLSSYQNATFIPWRVIVDGQNMYIVGYHEQAYSWTNWQKIIDYIIIYKLTRVNATWLQPVAAYGVPAFTGSWVGFPTHLIPYSTEYPGIGYLDKLDATYDNETGILYIAGQAMDQGGSWAAIVAAVNVSDGTVLWTNLIGADEGLDFASGIDLIRDYKGDKYLVVTGAINYTVSENLTDFNAFYALLNASDGSLKYIYVVGGKGFDFGFDLGQIVYESPEGPVIRPFYTAFTTNSTDLWIRDVTDLYNSGVLNTTSVIRGKPIPLSNTLSGIRLNTNIKPSGGSIKTIQLSKDDKSFTIESYQSGNMRGGLLQPALPPATTITVTHEPERAILWNDTTTHVLINITATLVDNWTGNPISGEEIWLYVAGPNITWHRNDTKITDATGTVQFQFNATQPGTYVFEVMFPGTAYYYRAFETFRIFLSPYKVIAELYANTTSIYTLFEKPVKLYGYVKIKNGTNYVPFANTTVVIDFYVESTLSYLLWGDLSHIGWFWDLGYYYPDLVVRTDNSGYFELVLTNTTSLGSIMYSLRSDWLDTGAYLIRAVVPPNNTIVTPENTSNIVSITVNPTPTRIVIVDAPTNNTSIRAGTIFNVTVRWEWSHDGFVTTHPIPNQTILMIYNAVDAGVVYGLIANTDENGEVTFTVSADHLGTLILSFTNRYSYADLADAYSYLNYTVTPAGINVTVTMPPDTLLSIDDYKIIVSVVDNETGEPKPNVVVWVFINGTSYTFTTDETGTVVIVHDFPDNGFISPGPMNVTVVVNGTVNVTGTLTKTYEVTTGEYNEKIVNVEKTPTYIAVTYPSLVNATEDYTATVYLLAKNSTGHWFSFTGATMIVTTNYGFTGTVASGSSITITGTPDAGNYTITISYPGSTVLTSNTTDFAIEARWFTSTVINPNNVTAVAINETYVKIVMMAAVYRYYFNESAWRPMPGVKVRFYYVGSLVYFAENITDNNGIAYGIGILPRGEPEALGAEASGATIQSSSDEVSIAQLPRGALIQIMPLPEPPILPLMLLAVIVLALVLKKRK